MAQDEKLRVEVGYLDPVEPVLCVFFLGVLCPVCPSVSGLYSVSAGAGVSVRMVVLHAPLYLYSFPPTVKGEC